MKTEIWQHGIEYTWEDENTERELSDTDIEHIKKLIANGYREGELCQFDYENEESIYGWWSIA